jgi:serine/threonine protein kinase
MSEALPELFARALELDDFGRRALVGEVLARDPALGAELSLLLENAAETGSPLDRSPWPADEDPEDFDHVPLERVGPYRIVRELGRGGMGRVYLAEEETEVFRRSVALKVIDRPRGDDEAVRRFRDEVRILSSLEHPGIARFLAGGRAPDGTWFLALELVEGEDLLTWARARDLSVRTRIELFVAALEAVQFAHARGIIHRDLKPSHLLVDRDGRPRLLDFGISKLIDPETQASLAETRTESRVLTPGYASPEQFRGDPLTPAADVYALGVVLYELLAGRRPFGDKKTPRADLERDVLERDPEAPSTVARRATSKTDTASATTGSKRFQVGELTRDLDAICLKALRKSPLERYADAGELAEDLRRYLAGLPVEARRGGRRYRAARFLRRHRGRLATAAALAIAVAIAVAGLRQAGRAPSPPAPPTPRAFPFSGAASLPLDELQREFAAAPASVEAGATLAIALAENDRAPEARLILSRVRQIPGRAEDPLIDYVEANIAMDLDEPQRALVLFTRARETAMRTGRGELVGQIRASRGRLLSILGERAEARSEMEQARQDFQRAGDHASLSRVLNDIAIEHLQQGELARGEELLTLAVAEGRAAGTFPGVMIGNLGLLAIDRGRPDLAEPRFREVLAERRRSSASGRRLGEILFFLAEAIREQGGGPERGPVMDEAIRELRKPGGEAVLCQALFLHGAADVDQARFDRVEATLVELDAAAAKGGGKTSLGFAHTLRGSATGARGELAEARRAFGVARRLFIENGDLDYASLLDAIHSRIEDRHGNTTAALGILEAARARLSGSEEGSAAFLTTVLRAQVDAEAGRVPDASRRLAAIGDAAASSPSLVRRVAFLSARSAVARAEGRDDAARSDLAAAISATRAAHWKLDELDLLLDLAALDLGTDESERGTAAARAVEAEARALGLHGIEARARVLAAQEAPGRRT